MADAGDGALALPAPLAIRCVGEADSRRFDRTDRWTLGGDEEEEKESEEVRDPKARRHSGDSESINKIQLKERQRAGSDGASAGSAQEDAGSGEEDEEEGAGDSERTQFRLRHRAAPPAAQAMRSPSRLAASLLVGRDRMARAARAWRDGARRAGLFGAEDDEDLDDDEEEKSTWSSDNQVYYSEIGFKRSSVSDPTSTSQEKDTAIDEPVQAPSLRDVDPDPAEDDSHVPVLVDTSRCSLTQPMSVPRLVPSRLAPATRVPKMAQLWAFLNRIECIAIRDVFTSHDDEDSSATVHYVLDVYNYQEQHSLPTHRYRGTTTRVSIPHASPSCSSPPLRKPDYHIEHRFSSFTKLRSRILTAAQLKHPNARAFPSDANAAVSSSHHRNCAYCRRVALFIVSGSECVAPLGWRTKFFTNVEMRKTLLSQFITELVFLAREQRDTCSNLATLTMMPQPPNRHIHRSVPGILRRFLTVQTGENFMR